MSDSERGLIVILYSLIQRFQHANQLVFFSKLVMAIIQFIMLGRWPIVETAYNYHKDVFVAITKVSYIIATTTYLEY